MESGLRDFFDNRQMGKDIWLYSFYKLIETSSLEKDEKIKLLQLLMDIFDIDNKMSAERHYYEMENNIEYKAYMCHCFDGGNNGRAAFWILNAAMSADGRVAMTVGYTEDYIKFMGQLEVYLSEMFKERGFGDKICLFLSELVSYISEKTTEGDNSAAADVRMLLNPVLYIVERKKK